MRTRVLVVDDQATIRLALREFFTEHGFEVDEAANCAAAEVRFRAVRPDAVLLDFRMHDGTALDVLPRLRAIDPNVPLAVLTGHGSIDLAVEAVKQGAEQFLTKPVELPALLVVLERMVENRRNRQKQLAAQVRARRGAVDPFVGTSDAIKRLEERAQRVARADSPTLIGGETGTGKGVLARWLHAHGSRAEEAFVDLNCGGLSREFLETELFGHEKGAFTGAAGQKPGLLEIADRGTVFLDEIGDVDMELQPKLLKVLEEKRFRRLGSVRDLVVDVRLISATHKDLAEAARNHRFRSDLYFRIATVPLVVPPLRERVADIPVLATEFLATIGADFGRNGVELAPDALDALRSYAWPGNIRELRNVLERALLLSDRSVLGREDLQFEATPPAAAAAELYDEDMEDEVVPRVANGHDGSDLSLADLERRHVEHVLQLTRGHVGRAAERLGIPRSSLYQKIKRFQIRLSKS